MNDTIELLHTMQYGDVCVDSRSVKKGDLFIALKGENCDGHDFVQSAFKNGAMFALVEKDVENVDQSRLMKVRSTYQSLVDLAKHNIHKANAKYIGVTGSVGKTTTKNLICHLLAKFFGKEVFSSRKNFNSQIGLPICAATMPIDTKIGIFEMGMSQKGEIRKLTNIVAPDIAVITSICEAHLKFFNCLWDIAKAKSEIIEKTKNAVVFPSDSAFTNFLKESAYRFGLKSYTFGRSNVSDARIISCERNKNTLEVAAEILGVNVQYEINGRNDALISNSLAAILTAHLISGIDLHRLAHEVASFTIDNDRGSIFEKNGVTIIDDSYNACPTSMKSAIKSMRNFVSTTVGPVRKILVIGDMRELGAREGFYHADLSATIDKFGVDHVFACGLLSKNLFENLQDHKRGGWYENSEEVSKELPKFIREGDVVLIKGSHSMQMHKIVEAIKSVL